MLCNLHRFRLYNSVSAMHTNTYDKIITLIIDVHFRQPKLVAKKAMRKGLGTRLLLWYLSECPGTRARAPPHARVNNH